MGLLINEEDIMLTYTYIEHGKFELREKPEPEIVNSREAIVRVTLGSICTSDLHIKHGSVPRAVPGITVGHEMVGVVEKVGADVTSVKPGDRVTVNVIQSATNRLCLWVMCLRQVFGQPVFQRFPRMILCLLLAPVLPESVLCCV